MLGQRPLGRTGLKVSEIGLSVAAPDAASAELVRAARDAGVDLFHLDDSDWLPWISELLGTVPATLLVGTRAPAIGGRYRPEAPDRHLRLLSFSALTVQPGAMGPYRILGGWEVGRESPEGQPSRLEAAREVLDASVTQAVGVTYTPSEQMAGLDFMRRAREAGIGLVAMDLRDASGPYTEFLVRPGRTSRQAEVQFVLANEYIASAIVSVRSPAELREALAAPEAHPLALSDLERVIETYAHRRDGGCV